MMTSVGGDCRSLVGLVILGLGNIGSAFIEELWSMNLTFPGQKIQFSFAAMANSTKILCCDSSGNSVTKDNWRQSFNDFAKPYDKNALGQLILGWSKNWNKLIVIDCTCSSDISKLYETLLSSHCFVYVVTANKKGVIGNDEVRCATDSAVLPHFDLYPGTSAHLSHLGFESTVGAGLPVINTIRAITSAGDKVTSIDAILSGTLAYLFNAFMPNDAASGSSASANFLDIVSTAHALGYTEPDPCDDLSGMDVARKLTIIGRCLGVTLPPSNGDSAARSLICPAAICNSIIPPGFTLQGKAGESEAVVQNRKEQHAVLNEKLNSMREDAKANGCVLRYVASLELEASPSAIGGASQSTEAQPRIVIGIQAVKSTSSLANAPGCDNIAVIKTRRFPAGIVLQGAGAGAPSTVHGLLSDMRALLASR